MTPASTPAIILVDPQMGENIGAAARAMFNCGLTDLRLVRPRDGWPNERAEAMSSGALAKMPPVRVFDTLPEAVADCHYVLATTARGRDMNKPVLTAREAAGETHRRTAEGQNIGLLFGAERMGLTNNDVALAHGIITVPLNPEFSSLNLGQAVLLVAYEWKMESWNTGVLEDESSNIQTFQSSNIPAPYGQLNELFERLEAELEAHHFFRNPDMRPSMVNNLRTMLARAEPSEQELRTFHGVISALIGKKGPPGEH